MGQGTRQGIQCRRVSWYVRCGGVHQDSVRVGQLTEDTHEPNELGSSAFTNGALEALELSVRADSAKHITDTFHPSTGRRVLVTLWVKVMQQTGSKAQKRYHFWLDVVVDRIAGEVVQVGLQLHHSLTVTKVGQYSVGTSTV